MLLIYRRNAAWFLSAAQRLYNWRQCWRTYCQWRHGCRTGRQEVACRRSERYVCITMIWCDASLLYLCNPHTWKPRLIASPSLQDLFFFSSPSSSSSSSSFLLLVWCWFATIRMAMFCYSTRVKVCLVLLSRIRWTSSKCAFKQPNRTAGWERKCWAFSI